VERTWKLSLGNRIKKHQKAYYDEYYLLNQAAITASKREHYNRNKDDIPIIAIIMFETSRKGAIIIESIICETRTLSVIRSEPITFATRTIERKYDREYYNRNKDTIKVSTRNYYIENLRNPEIYSPLEIVKSWKSSELVREFLESISPQLYLRFQRLVSNFSRSNL
jgi:hypothetical protein